MNANNHRLYSLSNNNDNRNKHTLSAILTPVSYLEKNCISPRNGLEHVPSNEIYVGGSLGHGCNHMREVKHGALDVWKGRSNCQCSLTSATRDIDYGPHSFEKPTALINKDFHYNLGITGHGPVEPVASLRVLGHELPNTQPCSGLHDRRRLPLEPST